MRCCWTTRAATARRGVTRHTSLNRTKLRRMRARARRRRGRGGRCRAAQEWRRPFAGDRQCGTHRLSRRRRLRRLGRERAGFSAPYATASGRAAARGGRRVNGGDVRRRTRRLGVGGVVGGRRHRHVARERASSSRSLIRSRASFERSTPSRTAVAPRCDRENEACAAARRAPSARLNDALCAAVRGRRTSGCAGASLDKAAVRVWRCSAGVRTDGGRVSMTLSGSRVADCFH